MARFYAQLSKLSILSFAVQTQPTSNATFAEMDSMDRLDCMDALFRPSPFRPSSPRLQRGLCEKVSAMLPARNAKEQVIPHTSSECLGAIRGPSGIRDRDAPEGRWMVAGGETTGTDMSHK